MEVTKAAAKSHGAPDERPSTAHAVSAQCGRVGEVLSRIGDKWSVLVVMLLRHGPRRFSELKREIGGVSQRMLTLTLRGLERDGLVTRSVYATTPPRVDYELTPLGHSLREPVEALGDWAFAHMDVIDKSRREFDLRLVAQQGDAVDGAPTHTHLLRLARVAR
jgi:DNA-binding HxlR family transcriptional regulator